MTRIETPGQVGYGDTDDAGRALEFTRLRPDTPVAATILAALIGAAGDHVPALLDVGTARNGDLVLVTHDDPVRLTDLLLRPGGLLAGEAVTVLVPLVGALARAHAAGVAHGAVQPGAIRFAPDGTPVLHDWADAVVADLHGPTAFAAAADRDRRQTAALAADLLDLRLDATLEPAAAIDALFAAADPMPVRLTLGDDGVPRPAPPGRIVPTATPAPPLEAQRGPRFRAAAVAAAGRAGGQLRGVRRRVWAAAAAAVLLLAAALVLLPGRGADAARAPAPTATAARTDGMRARTPASTAEHAPGSLTAPAAAARLLAARAACTAADCLRRVDAAGSPALVADLGTIAGHRRPALPPRGAARVVSTVGSAVVLEIGPPDRPWTVLVLREPAGWRIRDVVVPAAA